MMSELLHDGIFLEEQVETQEKQYDRRRQERLVLPTADKGTDCKQDGYNGGSRDLRR